MKRHLLMSIFSPSHNGKPMFITKNMNIPQPIPNFTQLFMIYWLGVLVFSFLREYFTTKKLAAIHIGMPIITLVNKGTSSFMPKTGKRKVDMQNIRTKNMSPDLNFLFIVNCICGTGQIYTNFLI
ncbi:hypothetical protein [Flavobacterium alkalisoli]|uniref:hypothetical protein n=1 Tax=Flavobacterium alkalisoli TaxID=2602769 RepID=UPI003A8F6622